MASKSVSDYIVEVLSPIYPVATDLGPDVGSVQELLKRWWTGEGNSGVPTGQLLYNRYLQAGAVGSSLQDLAYDFWSRGLLKSGIALDAQYIQFDGTAGNYASTPDSAALSIVGDIDLRIKVEPIAAYPSAASTLIAKFDSVTGQRSYMLRFESTGIFAYFSSTGADTVSSSQTPAASFWADKPWIRMTRAKVGGIVKFYTSPDGVTWTQLGSDGVALSGVDLFDSTAAVTIAGRINGGSPADHFAGKVYYAEIRNAIGGGTIAGSFTPYNSSVSAVRTPTTTSDFNGGAVWTLNGSTWSWGVFATPTITTPDSVISSITGDIDIRIFAAAIDWVLPGQTLLDKRAANAGYSLRIVTGGSSLSRIEFDWGDGVTQFFKTATVATPFAAGQAGWIRVTLDVDNGAGGNDLKFYTSTDGITWTQLGTTQTTAGVTNIADGTAVMGIGATSPAQGAQHFMGSIYYVEVRNGIEGPIVVKFDTSTIQRTGNQLPASVDGWTWNGATLYKRDDYVRLPGTSGNYLSYPSSTALNITGQMELRAKVALDNWTLGTDQTIIGKLSTTGNQRGYRLYVVATTGRIAFSASADGITSVGYQSSVSPTIANGGVLWLKATFDPVIGGGNGRAIIYTSPDGVTWTQLGAVLDSAFAGSIFQTTASLEIGSITNGTGALLAGNIYYAEVRNGIGGPVVAYFNGQPSAIQTPWTIAGAGWGYKASNFIGRPGIALQLPGTGGNFASTPDTPGNSVTGDIDLRCKCALTDWTPSASNTFIGKNVGDPNRGFRFINLTDGRLQLEWWPTGNNASVIAKPSTASVPFADGATGWVRCTLDVDNGASGNTVAFYTSTDGVVWTPLGAPVVTAGVTTMVDVAAAIEVGANFGGGSQQLAGNVFYAEVRNGIDGPIVAKFDPTNIAKQGTRLPTTTVQPGGTPNMLTPNQASIETDATGWAASVNCTIAQDATQFLDGTKSLAITAVAIGTTTVLTSTKFPVVVGKQYTATGSSRAAVTPRAYKIQVNWYTAAGVYISTLDGAQTVNSTSAWTTHTTTGVAPATATQAEVTMRNPDAATALGEVNYIDRISLVETPEVFTMNGSAWDLIAA